MNKEWEIRSNLYTIFIQESTSVIWTSVYSLNSIQYHVPGASLATDCVAKTLIHISAYFYLFRCRSWTDSVCFVKYTSFLLHSLTLASFHTHVCHSVLQGTTISRESLSFQTFEILIWIHMNQYVYRDQLVCPFSIFELVKIQL